MPGEEINERKDVARYVSTMKKKITQRCRPTNNTRTKQKSKEPVKYAGQAPHPLIKHVSC